MKLRLVNPFAPLLKSISREQFGLWLLEIQWLLVIGLAVMQFITPTYPLYVRILINAAAILYGISVLLYIQGRFFMVPVSIYLLSVIAGYAVNEPFITEYVAYAIYIPSALATATLSAHHVLGTHLVVWLIILHRADFKGAYTQPDFILVNLMTITALYLARRIFENEVVLLKEQKVEIDQSRKLLHLIIDDIPIGVYVAEGATGAPVIVNKKAAELLGRGFDSEVTAETYSEVYELIKPNGAPYPADDLPLVRALRDREVARASDLGVRKPDGTIMSLEALAAPVLDDKGNVVYGIGLFTDKTDRELLEKSKSDFIDIMSHHLRTPLTEVRLSADLLKEDLQKKMTPAQEMELKGIEHGITTMQQVMEIMLNIQALETGRMRIESKKIDVAKFITGLAEEMTAEKKERGRINIENLSGKTAINTDPKLFKYILSSLLANALMYSPSSKKVTIQISRNGSVISITVRDQGIGIPFSEQESVFSLFFKGSNTGPMNPTGQGTSLFIAKKAATALGGDLTFYSHPGKATTFELKLPPFGAVNPSGETLTLDRRVR